MRPAGEVRLALFNAARDFSAAGGATLAELATRACVGRDKARECVTSMRRAGDLLIVDERKVDYRNRKVKVYVAVDPQEKNATQQGWVDLDRCMGVWVQR